MLSALDNFYLVQQEPAKSCLVALRDIILKQDSAITPAWKYGMPFFYYKGKMFCYLWVHKKNRQPYMGIVEGKKMSHPDLILENRSRMKIMLFDPLKDLPITTIRSILKEAMLIMDSIHP